MKSSPAARIDEGLLTMTSIEVDSESDVVQEHFAIVHTKQRRRKRFPEGCVHRVASKAEAVASANSLADQYPALVYGPSRSSEGLRLYYLIHWLD
jgi:hypothetical protein